MTPPREDSLPDFLLGVVGLIAVLLISTETRTRKWAAIGCFCQVTILLLRLGCGATP